MKNKKKPSNKGWLSIGEIKLITYRDTTFCINEECTKKCDKYLTEEIEVLAQRFGLPVATASFICPDIDNKDEEDANV